VPVIGEGESRLEYLNSCLHLTEIPDRPVQAGDLDLFHRPAQVTIPDKISFNFCPGPVDLEFKASLKK
jgi:succinylglutamate desuccinylase